MQARANQVLDIYISQLQDDVESFCVARGDGQDKLLGRYFAVAVDIDLKRKHKSNGV